MEHLKQRIPPDTWTALQNCPLNGYALFPDSVIRKAENEIAQIETSHRTSQPCPGPGSSFLVRRDSDTGINRTHLHGSKPWILQALKTQPSGPDRLAWKTMRGSPVAKAGLVTLDVVPDIRKVPGSINENQCLVMLVPLA